MNSKTLILLSCLTAFGAVSCVTDKASSSAPAAPAKAPAAVPAKASASIPADAAKLIAEKKYDKAANIARDLLSKSPDVGLALSLELLKNPEFKQYDQLYRWVIYHFCNVKKDRDAFLKFNAELLAANAPCKYDVFAQNVAAYLYKKDNAKANELDQNLFEDAQAPAFVRTRHFISWGNRNFPERRCRRDRKEGIAKADQLLALKDLSGRDYGSLANFIANQYKQLGDEKNQEKYLNLILARKDMPVSFRVKASKLLALNCLNRKDNAGAEKLLTAFLSYPDVKWNEVYDDGYRILAKFYVWTNRLDQAIKLYDDFEAKYKVKQHRHRAELYATALKFDEAAKVCLAAKDYDYALRYMNGKDIHNLWLGILQDPAQKDSRRRAFLAFFDGTDEEMKIAEKYFDELYFKNPKDAQSVNLGYFNPCIMSNLHYANFEKLDRQLTMLFRFEKTRKNYSFVQTWIVAMYAIGKNKEAAAFAEQAKDTPEFTVQQKMILSILAKADSKNFASELDKILRAFPVSKELPAAKRADGLVLAGQAVLTGKLDNAAKIIDQAHKKLYAPEPRKVFDLVFAAKPIYGLSDFLAVKDTVKPQLMDRKFGGNMDLLVTDVSTGNRGDNIGTQQDKKVEYTEFYAICDARGLHMVFRIPTDDPVAMMDKLTGNGSFEMYLAPGENQPYTCFLTDVNDTGMSTWNTIYNTQQHRRIGKDSSNFVTEARAGEKCVWKYMFLSWKNYPVQLPENGECWEFENVHWSAAGGYGWNGTKSIHGRSTWGLLRFHLTKAQRTAIKRGLIFEASQSYNKEKVSNGRGNGILAAWQDRELGDPAFYNECLKPLVEKLDSYLPMLKSNMTDAEVDKVYNEALPGWLNIRFIAAELRTKYLARQMVAE